MSNHADLVQRLKSWAITFRETAPNHFTDLMEAAAALSEPVEAPGGLRPFLRDVFAYAGNRQMPGDWN